jgi:thymidylate synthase ThyX
VAYSARVLLDSVAPNGVRLTTLEVTFPRFVLAEFNTHRSFSRSSGSSRAVPTSKLIERIEQDPVLPVEWGRNKSGMSASEMLSAQEAEAAMRVWLRARDDAVAHAKELLELKVHKQELNRILEPFLWHTVIVTATEWENFFELRCAPNAQPEIRQAALRMREAIDASRPRRVEYDDWHTPLLQDDERGLDVETRKRISAARCARVSYLTHEGRREIEKDLELYERLKSDRHLSPFEHVATPAPDPGFHANFRGWIQMRVEIEANSAPQAQARRAAQSTSGV